MSYSAIEKDNPITEFLEKAMNDKAKRKVRYIYSMADCPKCDRLKQDLRENHTTFTERNGERLKAEPRLLDDIDKQAFLQLQMQNLTFPIDITIMVDDE